MMDINAYDDVSPIHGQKKRVQLDWVSVKEALPVDGMYVLFTDGEDVWSSNYSADGKLFAATHWTTIPNLPGDKK